MRKETPLKSVRSYCLNECENGGSYKKVKLCYFLSCPLYRFRSGHNIMRLGIGNFNAKPPKRNNLESEDDNV